MEITNCSSIQSTKVHFSIIGPISLRWMNPNVLYETMLISSIIMVRTSLHSNLNWCNLSALSFVYLLKLPCSTGCRNAWWIVRPPMLNAATPVGATSMHAFCDPVWNVFLYN